MQNALLITAIGMGLVFVSIVLLWWMMELLVKFTTEKKVEPQMEATDVQAAFEEEQPAPKVNKQKIAALAVAAALQIQKQQAAEQAVKMAMQGEQSGAAQPVLNVSSWQTVRRSGQFEARANLFSRRSR